LEFTVGPASIPGLDNRVPAWKSGRYQRTVKIDSAEAYGDVNPECAKLLRAKAIPADIPLEWHAAAECKQPDGSSDAGMLLKWNESTVTLLMPTHPLEG